ncbi:uncharacterized protein BDV17DRAFT_229427 [Aspergillus undulatus]|uniref:uncharacterized protein n=1 Tax=Aspergillus undulatus TaxID=1810928 RepID=UPI003CCD40F2
MSITLRNKVVPSAPIVSYLSPGKSLFTTILAFHKDQIQNGHTTINSQKVRVQVDDSMPSGSGVPSGNRRDDNGGGDRGLVAITRGVEKFSIAETAMETKGLFAGKLGNGDLSDSIYEDAGFEPSTPTPAFRRGHGPKPMLALQADRGKGKGKATTTEDKDTNKQVDEEVDEGPQLRRSGRFRKGGEKKQ